jgi:hypothetical protein
VAKVAAPKDSAPIVTGQASWRAVAKTIAPVTSSTVMNKKAKSAPSLASNVWTSRSPAGRPRSARQSQGTVIVALT